MSLSSTCNQSPFHANQAVANHFTTIANDLAETTDNPHRIRAYRRAAQSILNLSEDLTEIAQRNELDTIPGIGRELSTKILEFLGIQDTHTAAKAKESAPTRNDDWTSLPGITSSLARYLQDRLRITSLADLETLTRSHMLRTIPGVRIDETRLLEAIRERLRRPTPPEVEPASKLD
jgi:DNA polymerase (family 10)